MSREFKSWASDAKRRRGPRITLVSDALRFFGRRMRRPAGAPPEVAQPTNRLGWQQLRALNLAGLFAPRVDLEVVGSDALVGLDTPFIFAANEAGRLDHQLLRIALPRRLRPGARRLSRALAKRHNIVVFSADPHGGRLVGEFDTVAAELAKQHSVAVVPVGIVGTFRLSQTLKLRLVRKPKVSVRFGAPIYARGQSIEDVTREVQARVEHLVNEGELSWWEVERRRLGGPDDSPATMPRWRRLWEQAAPRPSEPQRRRIWR
ncbi:MAG: hypothetical protein GX596_04835 [Propionibacterium sp.]|nr:hypothetical protein [Propionibacterium sp.]